MVVTKDDVYVAALNAGFSLIESEFGSVTVYSLKANDGGVGFTSVNLGELNAFLVGYLAGLTK